jgi:hypothetical protein
VQLVRNAAIITHQLANIIQINLIAGFVMMVTAEKESKTATKEIEIDDVTRV